MVCVYLYTYTLPPLSFAMNRKKNENTSRGRKNSNFVPASTSCAVFIRLCVVYISFNSISAACCRTAVAGFCYFFFVVVERYFCLYFILSFSISIIFAAHRSLFVVVVGRHNHLAAVLSFFSCFIVYTFIHIFHLYGEWSWFFFLIRL